MSNWIHIVLLLVQSFTNAWRVFYVSNGTASSNESASLCTLATPDIQFKPNKKTVALDGANLDIAVGESMWSGYVQNYAALLYEGCCDEQFANSSANYTGMYEDPGECFSRCDTDIIGMQKTTCHCNPRPEETRTHATGCNSKCSDPAGTVCGGSESVSIYRKVKYPVSGDNEAMELNKCLAFYWKDDAQPFYTWTYCRTNLPFLCDNNVSSSTAFEYHLDWQLWSKTVEMCLQGNTTPAAALSFRFPDFKLTKYQPFWIGLIRSRVIDKVEGSNPQASGLRRGVIIRAPDGYVLQFRKSQTKLKSLCENVWTSPQPSDHSSSTTRTRNKEDQNGSDQQSQIAVFTAVPTVLVFLVVVVIVIICKRKKNVRGNEDARVEYRGTDPGRDSTIDTGPLYQNTGGGHGTKLVEKGMPQGHGTEPGTRSSVHGDALYQNTGVVDAEGSAEGHGTKLAERGMPQGSGTEPGSGSSFHADALYQNTGVGKAIYGENPQHDYQELYPEDETSQTHAYLTIGNAAQLGGSPQQEYEDLNPNDETSPTHEYSTIGNDAQGGEIPQQEYEDLNPNADTSPTHEYSTIGNEANFQ